MKIQVSQDTLYEYMLAHDIKMTRLAKLIGKSDDVVTSCFKHHKDWHGRPRSFNREHIIAINKALPVIANELQERLLTFGSKQVYTNQRGTTYDPALVEQIKELGKYLNITSLLTRLLGWSKGKKSAVFCQPSSKAYGTISEVDMTTINTEILSIVGVLNCYELIVDNNNEDSSADDEKICSSQEGNNKTQTHLDYTEKFAWENTKLNISERSRLLKESNPNGMLLFRVNDGYAVEGEDANYVYGVDNSIRIFTDPITNATTAFIDGESIVKILPQFIAQGRRVVFTDLKSD